MGKGMVCSRYVSSYVSSDHVASQKPHDCDFPHQLDLVRILGKLDSPIIRVTDKRLILKMCLDMRMDRALPREMSFTTLDQAFESLHWLTRDRCVESQECNV